MKFVSMQHCVAASKLSVPQYSTATKTKLIIKFLQLNLHCCTMYKAKGWWQMHLMTFTWQLFERHPQPCIQTLKLNFKSLLLYLLSHFCITSKEHYTPFNCTDYAKLGKRAGEGFPFTNLWVIIQTFPSGKDTEWMKVNKLLSLGGHRSHSGKPAVSNCSPCQRTLKAKWMVTEHVRALVIAV